MTRRFRDLALLAAALLALNGLGAAARAADGGSDWPAYLFGPTHPSYNAAATAISPSTVGSLAITWRFTPDPASTPGQPPAYLYATPVVYQGRVYVGTGSGDFYALDETTGAVIWKRAIGYVPLHECKPSGGGGFVSTATVAPDPVTGATTIYVAAGDGYLYALDALDGSVRWRSVVGIPTPGIDDYYNWASPTVVAGRIYMGVSSNCDRPFVPGGLDEFDQATGELLASYRAMPDGYLGGAVWTSAMATPDGQTVWITTGSTTNGAAVLGDSYSIVRLDGPTLARLEAWQIPASQRVYDSDFGSSPVLIQATVGGAPTDLVVACNKNGIFYAWRAYDVASGPVWQRRVASARRDGKNRLCLAAGVWDGSRLFVATNGTTIRGKRYLGSARRLDPATGRPVWETGLNGAVTGTPTLDGSGVLAVATYDFTGATNRVYLLNAATGAILRKLATTAPAFPQPVMADTHLFVATQNHGLIAFGLPSAPAPAG